MAFARLICLVSLLHVDIILSQRVFCQLEVTAADRDHTFDPPQKKMFSPGETLSIQCGPGSWVGSKDNTSAVTTCQDDGTWSVDPTCRALQCPAIYPDSNVRVQGDTENASYRNSVHFSCRSNRHILSGPQEISCNEHGEWSGPVPTCNEIKCERPNIPNGFVRGPVIEYWENDFLHYGCNPGHQPAAGMLPRCTNLGLRADWSPAPKCDAADPRN